METIKNTIQDSWLAKMSLIALAIGWVPFYMLSLATASLQG